MHHRGILFGFNDFRNLIILCQKGFKETLATNFIMEFIVAVSQNGVIGDSERNTMLWNIPEDLSRFAKITRGQVVIMGHNTFQSLPNGKLKNRINIVLTRSPPPPPQSCEEKEDKDDLFFVDISRLWNLLIRFVDKKVFVIGGGSIYKLLYPFCSTVYYTLVDLEPVGDVMFPYSREWLRNNSESVDEGDWMISGSSGIQYKYITYNIKQ